MEIKAIGRKNIYLHNEIFDLLMTIYLKTFNHHQYYTIAPAMAECSIDIKIATDGTELK